MQGEIEVCGFRVGSGKKAAIVSVLSPPPEKPQVNTIFPVLSFPPTQRNLNFHWPSELCPFTLMTPWDSPHSTCSMPEAFSDKQAVDIDLHFSFS